MSKRWKFIDEALKDKVGATISRLMDSSDDEIALRAGQEARHLEAQNQRDEQHEDMKTRGRGTGDAKLILLSIPSNGREVKLLESEEPEVIDAEFETQDKKEARDG